MNLQRLFGVTLTLLVLSIVLSQTACDAGLRDVAGIDSLMLEFRSNRSQARVGEPIQMRFTISNTGRNHIIIESQDTPVMDILVESRAAHGVYFTWSDLNPDRVAHRLEWKPGESKTIELTWIPKEGDTYTGARHIVFLTGLLYQNSKILRSAGVGLCAEFC